MSLHVFQPNQSRLGWNNDSLTRVQTYLHTQAPSQLENPEALPLNISQPIPVYAIAVST